MRVGSQALTHGGFVASTMRGAVGLAFCLLAFSSAAFAQTDTWGGGTGFWSQGTLWSTGVPTPGSNVIVGPVQSVNSVLTVNQNGTVSSLELDPGANLSPTQLILPGDSLANQSAAVNLTVNGATTLAVNTLVYIGTGSSLTLNGAATNNTAVSLYSTTIQVGTAPDIGTLNGTGTLTNNGTIYGNNLSAGNTGGIIGINIMNSASGALSGDLTLNGITVTGGTFGVHTGDFSSNLTAFGATVDNMQFIGFVTLTGGSTLTAQGSLNQDALEIAANATLNILSTTNVTSYDLSTDTGGTLNNAGALNETGKVLFNRGTFNNSGSLLTVALSNSGSVTNSGAMTFNVASPGFESDVENAGAFTNMVGGTINNTGAFTNDAGATLTNLGAIADSGFLTNLGTIDNKGTLTEGTELVSTLGATLNNTGTIVIKSGVVFLNFDSVLDNFAGGQITNNGDLESDKGSTITNAGTFTNNGTLTNGYVTFTNSGVLNNAGSLENETTMTNAGVLNNTGSFKNTQGGQLNLLAGSTLNNSGSFISDSSSGFATAASSTIVNTGGVMTFSGNPVAINGTLRNDGQIDLMGIFSTTGDIPFIQPAPPLLVTSTGKLSGTGTVTGFIIGGGVIVDGVMSPGDLGGTFTINGYYTQNATGIMDILLGGTGAGQFGQLDVTGPVDLGGVLDVELFGGFDPQAGEKFEFLESDEITGGFSSLLFPTLGDGLFFKLDREGNNLFLDVMEGSSGGGGGTTPPSGTPESSSLLMLSSALAGLGSLALRKRQNGVAVQAAQYSRAALSLSSLQVAQD